MPRAAARTSRSSVLPPVDGRLHLGWQRLRAALRGGGLAPGLVESSWRDRLGPAANLRPSPEAIFSLLDRHFTSRESLSEGRYLAYREKQSESARQIVTRLASIVPELSCLRLVEESHRGQSGFVLRTRQAYALVSSDSIETEAVSTPSQLYERRTITVDALVECTNRLLHFRGVPQRLLPLQAPDGVAAYLGADPHSAAILAEVELWDEEPDELCEFGYIADWPAATCRVA